ncbi:MAG: SRPBCC family protein [Chloroflexota bacterium]|nr:SRPBCC family protein [Chloroflexota bacterium]
MGRYTFRVHVDTPPEQVFALWTNLDRMAEWVGGVTGVTDVTGPVDQVGTRYTTQFGKMSSPTEVIAVDRPRLFRTRFGNRILRGESQAIFEPDGNGTSMTQEFWTKGVIAAIAARLFATGSYKGSFRGELQEFARIASAEAKQTPSAGP